MLNDQLDTLGDPNVIQVGGVNGAEAVDYYVYTYTTLAGFPSASKYTVTI